MNLLLVNMEGDVAGSGGVEVDEGVGRDGEVALAARNEDPLIGAAAGDAVVALMEVVFDLRVVGLKRGGEVGGGRCDEHEVAAAGEGDAVGDCLVGFDLLGVETALEGIGTHGAAEVFGCLGEGTDVDGEGVGVKRILDSLSGVEEGVVEEVPNGACAAALALHHGEDVEVEAVDAQVAAFLGEEGAATDFRHLVATAVDCLFILFYLLADAEVFSPESLVAGQLVDGKLADRHLGVDLVGDDNLLALIGVALVDGGTGEESVGVDFGGRLGLLRPGVEGLAALLLCLLLLLPLLLLCLAEFLHLDSETL